MRTAYYKQNTGASIIGMTYFALVVAGMFFLTGYAVYLSTIKNPPCIPCVNGLSQELGTTTFTTNACNRTNVTQQTNDTTVLYNFTVSGGCIGPPGKNANITILIKNNATNTVITESSSSVGQSIYNLNVTANTTYHTLPGPTGPKGNTSTVPGPQGIQGPQGPQGIPGTIPTRTFRITGPIKQYIPIPVPPGATLLSYTLIGGGGGGGGGCGEGFASRGGGAGGGGGSGFKTQGLFIIDPLNPPIMTVRLGMGGWGGVSSVVNSASDGQPGYPTQLLLDGNPFDLSAGGFPGQTCNRADGKNGGYGGYGGYGGGGGGIIPHNNQNSIPGGQSQLYPDAGVSGYPYQASNQYTGGRGAGPNAGIGGVGDGSSRTGGGGGGGGLLPNSGGNGSNFTGTASDGGDGGGGMAGDGQYGGGGGGAPGCWCNVDVPGGTGGAGYMEYIFF